MAPAMEFANGLAIFKLFERDGLDENGKGAWIQGIELCNSALDRGVDLEEVHAWLVGLQAPLNPNNTTTFLPLKDVLDSHNPALVERVLKQCPDVDGAHVFRWSSLFFNHAIHVTDRPAQALDPIIKNDLLSIGRMLLSKIDPQLDMKILYKHPFQKDSIETLQDWQKLSVENALRACTWNGYGADFLQLLLDAKLDEQWAVSWLKNQKTSNTPSNLNNKWAEEIVQTFVSKKELNAEVSKNAKINPSKKPKMI